MSFMKSPFILFFSFFISLTLCAQQRSKKSVSSLHKAQPPAPPAKPIPVKDPYFYKAIVQQCPECIDTAGNLLPPAAKLSTLVVGGNLIENHNLEGIEGFTSLQYLTIEYNWGPKLPPLPSSLIKLYCTHCNIEELPELPSGLTELWCNDDELKTLPSLPSGLQILNCSSNPLASLPALPSSIISINANWCNLTSLPDLPEGLSSLNVLGNNLTAIPHIPSSLRILYFNDNTIKCIPNKNDLLEVYGVLDDRHTEFKTDLNLCGTGDVATKEFARAPDHKKYIYLVRRVSKGQIVDQDTTSMPTLELHRWIIIADPDMTMDQVQERAYSKIWNPVLKGDRGSDFWQDQPLFFDCTTDDCDAIFQKAVDENPDAKLFDIYTWTFKKE